MHRKDNDRVTYSNLRAAIDCGDIAAIQSIFADYPALDWNAVTLNRHSALWWAITPPTGGMIKISVITALLQLKRNDMFVIDIRQTYEGITIENYISRFLKCECDNLKNTITNYKVAYLVQLRSQSTRHEDQHVNESHSASSDHVIRSSDGSLKRLHDRYTRQGLFDVDAEWHDIDAYLRSKEYKQAFPLMREQQDQIAYSLIRIESDVDYRSDMNPEQGPRQLREALGLAWCAAKQTANSMDSKKAVMLAVLESKTAYSLAPDSHACWAGTWGRIGTALAEKHPDVYFNTIIILSRDLAMAKYSVHVGDILALTYNDSPVIYWAIIRKTLGIELAGDENEYKQWTKRNIANLYAKLVEEKNIAVDDIILFIESFEIEIPLARHDLSRQIETFYELYSQVDAGREFETYLRQGDDVLESLKHAYINKYMKVPDDLKEMKPESEDLDKYKQKILTAMLARPVTNEKINEKLLWDEIRGQVKINRLNNKLLSCWYANLSPTNKLLLLEEVMNSDFSIDSIASFAFENGIAKGMPLRDVNFNERDLRGYDLREVDFSGVNLQGSNLGLIVAEGAKWDGCHFSKIRFNIFLHPEIYLASLCATAQRFSQFCDDFGLNAINSVLYANDIKRMAQILRYCDSDFVIKNFYCLGDFNAYSIEMLTVIVAAECCTEVVIKQMLENGKRYLMDAKNDVNELFDKIGVIVNTSNCTENCMLYAAKGTNVLNLAISRQAYVGARAILNSQACTDAVRQEAVELLRKPYYLINIINGDNLNLDEIFGENAEEDILSENMLDHFHELILCAIESNNPDATSQLVYSKYCDSFMSQRCFTNINKYFDSIIKMRGTEREKLSMFKLIMSSDFAYIIFREYATHEKSAIICMYDKLRANKYLHQYFKIIINSPACSTLQPQLEGKSIDEMTSLLDHACHDNEDELIIVILNSPQCTTSMMNTKTFKSYFAEKVRAEDLKLVRAVLNAQNCPSDILESKCRDGKSVLDTVIDLSNDSEMFLIILDVMLYSKAMNVDWLSAYLFQYFDENKSLVFIFNRTNLYLARRMMLSPIHESINIQILAAALKAKQVKFIHDLIKLGCVSRILSPALNLCQMHQATFLLMIGEIKKFYEALNAIDTHDDDLFRQLFIETMHLDNLEAAVAVIFSPLFSKGAIAGNMKEGIFTSVGQFNTTENRLAIMKMLTASSAFADLLADPSYFLTMSLDTHIDYIKIVIDSDFYTSEHFTSVNSDGKTWLALACERSAHLIVSAIISSKKCPSNVFAHDDVKNYYNTYCNEQLIIIRLLASPACTSAVLSDDAKCGLGLLKRALNYILNPGFLNHGSVLLNIIASRHATPELFWQYYRINMSGKISSDNHEIPRLTRIIIEKIMLLLDDFKKASLLFKVVRDEDYVLARFIISCQGCTTNVIRIVATSGRFDYILLQLCDIRIFRLQLATLEELSKHSKHESDRTLSNLFFAAIKVGNLEAIYTMLSSPSLTTEVLLTVNSDGDSILHYYFSHITCNNERTTFFENLLAREICTEDVMLMKNKKGETILDIIRATEYDMLINLVDLIPKRVELSYRSS